MCACTVAQLQTAAARPMPKHICHESISALVNLFYYVKQITAHMGARRGNVARRFLMKLLADHVNIPQRATFISNRTFSSGRFVLETT